MAVRFHGVRVEQRTVPVSGPCEYVMTIRFEAPYSEIGPIMVAAREFFMRRDEQGSASLPEPMGEEVAYEVD